MKAGVRTSKLYPNAALHLHDYFMKIVICRSNKKSVFLWVSWTWLYLNRNNSLTYFFQPELSPMYNADFFLTAPARTHRSFLIQIPCGHLEYPVHHRTQYAVCYKINVKTIAFGNKEHTTDQKMGVSVLLGLFISSNEVCNTAYAL